MIPTAWPRYVAGMQALCARALFALIPEATTVMVPRLLLSSAGCLGACCRGGSGSASSAPEPDPDETCNCPMYPDP